MVKRVAPSAVATLNVWATIRGRKLCRAVGPRQPTQTAFRSVRLDTDHMLEGAQAVPLLTVIERRRFVVREFSDALRCTGGRQAALPHRGFSAASGSPPDPASHVDSPCTPLRSSYLARRQQSRPVQPQSLQPDSHFRRPKLEQAISAPRWWALLNLDRKVKSMSLGLSWQSRRGARSSRPHMLDFSDH